MLQYFTLHAIIQLLILGENDATSSVALTSNNHKRNYDPNLTRSGEFIVGSDFRVQVVLSEDLKNHLHYDTFMTTVISALKFWTNALQPKLRNKQPILIKRKTVYCRNPLNSSQPDYSYSCKTECAETTDCAGVIIPKHFLQDCHLDEINPVKRNKKSQPSASDFLLFISSNKQLCSKHLVHSPVICQRDSETDRPTAATILICSDLKYIEGNPNHLKRILMHKLGHAFGFAYSMFPYLRHSNNEPRTKRNNLTREPDLPDSANDGLRADSNTIKYVNRTWSTVSGEHQFKRIGLTLPGVLNFARSHFNCSELDAVDLESDGDIETRLNHFERRLSIGEIMSSKLDIMASVSNLTLNYFNETGWYNVSFSMAEQWNWGRNQGCNFIFNSCSQFNQIQNSNHHSKSPWCTELPSATSSGRCALHTNAYGVCNLLMHSSHLKPEHQYFNNVPNIPPELQGNIGGFDILADHCPYISVFDNIRGTNMNSHCEDTNNRKYQNMLSDLNDHYYGKSSRCIQFGRTYDSSYYDGYNTTNAGCFKVNCSINLNHQVMFKGKWYPCPTEGGTIRIDNQTVSYDWLECPSYNVTCSAYKRKERVAPQNTRKRNFRK
ncbi:unnamed protein product [Schistosoma turkestanicum]|nr:unnamed protein product [Schistosoma turkestanicum]